MKKTSRRVVVVGTGFVGTRIIEPCSKRATFEYKKRFLHQSTYQLEDVYRTLHILYQERY